ncbi:hypothetical protein EV666_10662 [Camelimonas lactis]|uniref:Uncharacterized protein n=1 Tax=Camelimonas lactis TaxID=659006 RepID=A0A4R2GSP7_9HYPH|nr:hypothetical protein EV666_10662 [Camelimonas lactis]
MSQAGRPFSIGGVITADVAPAAWRRGILNENQIPLSKRRIGTTHGNLL